MTVEAWSRGEFWRAWLAVALWTALVWVLSSDGFSAGSTAQVIGPIVRWLFPGISARQFELVHFAIRKTAHLTEYAVLALLTLRALRRSAPRLARHATLLALAFVVAVASADELHQSRSRVRTGQPSDVAFDASGGALALGVLLLFERRFGVQGRARYRSPERIPSDTRGAPIDVKDL
ncbi:MAG TPA: VanZ family protein [Myxococcota bacterium]|nr:VanZ family protein [Myxococcota bacterium]